MSAPAEADLTIHNGIVVTPSGLVRGGLSASGGVIIHSPYTLRNARNTLAALCITVVAQIGVVPKGISVPDRERAKPILWPRR